jgi:hypothetical protein
MLIIFSLIVIFIYFTFDNFLVEKKLHAFENVSARLFFDFKRSLIKDKCDEIYLNLYKLHSTLGSKYPKRNISLYDSNLYKSFNSERIDNAQIKNTWLVDSDFKDMQTDVTKTFISNKNIVEVMEFISNLNKKDTSYINHQALEQMLKKHLNSSELTKKKVVTFGFYDKDYTPWIETILYKMNNQSMLEIVDYKQKTYEHFNFKWTSLLIYLRENYDKSMASSTLFNQYEQYDIIISHQVIDKVKSL